MIGPLIALASILYIVSALRAQRAGRHASPWRTLAFVAGLGTLGVALLGPLDDRADASLAWHMVQHVLLIGVAAPLLLLGAPLRVALAALPSREARGLSRILNSTPVRVLTHPAIAWLQFALVLYGTHFSPLYEVALENETVHAFEHLLYLGSALVFWMPLLAVAPAPHAPQHPVRLLAVFLAIPLSAFLGFIFYVARTPLYAHYAAHPGALLDQMNAGAVMWIAGGFPLFAAMLWLIGDWAARERRTEAIVDGWSR